MACIVQKIIPAIRHMKNFEYALELPIKYIILLESSLTNLNDIVRMAQKSNKKVLVHVDLIEGLQSNETAINFLAQQVRVDGIISTRKNVLQVAKKNNMISIQRLFVIDSSAVRTGIENACSIQPDFIELLPGIAYQAVKEVSEATDIPIITGGLIKDKKDVERALSSGAVSVTTSKKALWNMTSFEN